MIYRLGCLLLVGAVILAAGCENDRDSDGDTDSDSHPEGLSWRLHENIESLVYVSWPQEESAAVYVEYEIDGQWQQTPRVDASPPEGELLIAGIPFATEARWRVVQEDGKSLEGYPITTGPLPIGLPAPSVTVSEESRWFQEGKYLLSSINQDTAAWSRGTFWAYIIDRKGRFVWAQATPLEHWTIYVQVAVTGDRIIYDEATKWTEFDNGAGSRVHFTYLDEGVEVVDTPGLHHAFVQLPDGTLAWGSKFHGGVESLVEKAPGKPDVSIIWSVETDWAVSETYVESNCLFYNQATDSYLYSFYTNDSVVEVDRKTGNSLWWAGNAKGGYGFVPPESQYDWQHGVSYTDDGTLLVSTRVDGKEGLQTYLREYEVSHKSQTLTQVWSFDSGAYASFNGDAWRLSNGNTLHIVGSAGQIVEVDSAGDVVWRVEYPEPRLLGRGEYISDLYGLVSPN